MQRVGADQCGHLPGRQQRVDIVQVLLGTARIAEADSMQGNAAVQRGGRRVSLSTWSQRDGRPGVVEERKQPAHLQQRLVELAEDPGQDGEAGLGLHHGVQIQRHVAQREPASMLSWASAYSTRREEDGMSWEGAPPLTDPHAHPSMPAWMTTL
jgi:hypothetical protein